MKYIVGPSIWIIQDNMVRFNGNPNIKSDVRVTHIGLL